MSIFTSDRERRLWLWALAVTVAIYSTMGPARTLVDALRERNLLRISFALVLIVLVGAIAGRWVKKRPGWGEIGVALGVALAYLARFSGWGARRSALTLSSMASWPPSSTRRSWNECGMAAECRRLLPSPWG